MQGRENTGESIVYRQLLEQLYPGKCGYKSETGGIMKNLRESTTNENVMNYYDVKLKINHYCSYLDVDYYDLL